MVNSNNELDHDAKVLSSTSNVTVGHDVKKGNALMRRFKSCSGIGIFLGIAASFIFALGSLLVKTLNSNAKMHPFLLAAYRQSFLLFLAAPQVAYCKAPYFASKPDWLPLACRAFFGTIGLALGNFSLAYLPLGDAGVVHATTPAFTLILGRIILKEKLCFSDIPVFLLTFFGLLLIKSLYKEKPSFSQTGVVFILRPPFIFASLGFSSVDIDGTSVQDRLIGCAFGLGAALGLSCSYLAIRQLRHVNFATISFIYSLLTGPTLFVVVFATQNFALPPCYTERSMTLAISVTAILGQSLQAIASKFVSAGIISLSSSAEAVFRFLCQVVFLGTAISPSSLIGCLLVTIGMSFLSLRTILVEKYKKTPPQSKFLQKLLVIFR